MVERRIARVHVDVVVAVQREARRIGKQLALYCIVCNGPLPKLAEVEVEAMVRCVLWIAAVDPSK